ncbi:hypothetical protein [Synechocystis sp. FACHB-383]|uniref:hypothetical protein n=1 Tax=Synechocystis sp. FACHB-383 TaxID=2692864 RepID=UPI001F54C568|nr:hypothetical protein [Synechocystis sp. FACHB-383]
MTAKPTGSWPLPFTSTLLAQTPSTEIEEPELREPEDNEPPELTEDPQGQSNPFLAPELDELVDNKISEDVWSQMLGELPCSVTTEDCINQLQNTAVQRSRLLADLQQKIDESIAAVEEARQKNLDSIAISNFSPFLQVFLYSTLGPSAMGWKHR